MIWKNLDLVPEGMVWNSEQPCITGIHVLLYIPKRVQRRMIKGLFFVSGVSTINLWNFLRIFKQLNLQLEILNVDL